MAEKTVEEMLKKYLGISIPRIGIAILMIVFGILIIVFPALIAWLIGLYLIIAGILALIDEYMKSRTASLSISKS